MSLILHIDTATEKATVSIAENGQVLNFITNDNQKEHASFLQPAIKLLLKKTNSSINQLDAVSVTAGPGSYTGLRVGMAGAKGICYALQIPLIILSTLEVMAFSAIQNTAELKSFFYCPMIDAGRMEVFTALFNEQLNVMISPCALILEPEFLEDFLHKKKIIICGSGAEKFLKLSKDHSNLLVKDTAHIAPALALLSMQKFGQKEFSDLLNAEPAYLKQFYIFNKTS